jgi:DnaJ-domain-containing protein 1
MWDSIYRLPVSIEYFWDAHFINKAQILFLLFLLYLFGYYSSKLLVNRNIFKWGIFLFFFLPFLVSIFHSKQIIFIFPVAIGILKGFFIGNVGFSPFGAFEGITDFFLSVRHRRGHAELHRKYEEAEEILRRAKQYENQTRDQYQAQADSKEQFREEMRQQRERQEQEASRKEQQSGNSDKHTHSNEDEMRWGSGYRAKPEEDASESPPKGDRTRKEKAGNSSNQQKSKPKSETSPKSKDPRDLNPNILADAYEILGVSNGASLDECKKARLALLQMHHPDKVAYLNKTRRKMAEEETKRINMAWNRVKKSS